MKVLDAHTHLSGSGAHENTEGIVHCLEACEVDKAFVFAPLVDVHSWQLVDEHLNDIRAHNDYCADICSGAPDRLLAFCVLNPAPGLGNGSLDVAVDLMIEEAKRCYHDLGMRGVKMVPDGWYPYDPPVIRLYEALADLGMYVAFHSGIFLDGHAGRFCRPVFYEAVHQVPELRAQLAHLSWPWVDECIATLGMETIFYGNDTSKWQLKADLSFGPPDDWQLKSWELALDSLPHTMFFYASDVFWPCTPERYREQFLQPQLGLFEVAATNGHIAEEGSGKRAKMREEIFFDNCYAHWQAAVREPQQPRAAKQPVLTPRARAHTHDKPKRRPIAQQRGESGS
ncbi:MAG TPA: amidohydrolase family protein [Chloroflexota bacterium]|nr:amidohydrolase family protein [Chloroflexota bacterium]